MYFKVISQNNQDEEIAIILADLKQRFSDNYFFRQDSKAIMATLEALISFAGKEAKTKQTLVKTLFDSIGNIRSFYRFIQTLNQNEDKKIKHLIHNYSNHIVETLPKENKKLLTTIYDAESNPDIALQMINSIEIDLSSFFENIVSK